MSLAQPNTNYPPAYNSLRPSDNEAAKVEELWSQFQNGDWSGPGKHNIVFTSTCKPLQLSRWNPRRIFRDRKEHPIWWAHLFVWSKNIPRLMLHGFHWSPKDAVPGAGHLSINKRGREHRRCYKYEDSSPSKEWLANLVVHAWDPSVVTDFNLDWVTEDTVTKVKAWNWGGWPVYGYESRQDRCFNIIYDRMPLKGWWPWLKAGVEEDSPVEEDGGEKMVCESSTH